MNKASAIPQSKKISLSIFQIVQLHAKATEQVFSSVTVLFKGVGFYSTDRKRSWWEKPGTNEAMAMPNQPWISH
jgi:hypothetical protein